VLIRNTAVIGLAAALAVACIRVPYTKRVQFNLIPDGIMNGIGKSSYPQLLAKKPLLKKGPSALALNRVGNRVAKVADKPKYDWQFSLIKEDTVNAWCLPGGYIGFYQGILPVLNTEAGMAAVMGHEVGHATAHHGAERLSQKLALIGGLGALYAFMELKTEIKDEHKAIILAAVGAGAVLGVILPFSRAHEAEADVVGMMYMAEAGYPPQESVKVWQRMKKLSSGGVPSFISTHPSHEHRIKHLQKWMDQGDKKYRRSSKHAGVTTELWKD
jgi:metalloendopeptidase OMA1, mitochondrial